MKNIDLLNQTINDAVLPEDLALPKYTETRGYLYLLQDSAFPDWIKIGRTIDPQKRLSQYNSDRPLDTCRFTYISKPFVDVVRVEKVILTQLSLVVHSSSKSKEWFNIKNKDLLIQWIEKAETEAKLLC